MKTRDRDRGHQPSASPHTPSILLISRRGHRGGNPQGFMPPHPSWSPQEDGVPGVGSGGPIPVMGTDPLGQAGFWGGG